MRFYKQAALVLWFITVQAAYSQVPSVTLTQQGYALSEYQGPYTAQTTDSQTCTADGCVAGASLTGPNSNGTASASKSSISGSLSRASTELNIGANIASNYKTKIYAKVPVGQEVCITGGVSASVSDTNNSNNIENNTGAACYIYSHNFVAMDGVGTGVLGPKSGSKVARVCGVAANVSTEINGETYYLVGNVEIDGRAKVIPFNGPNPSVSYTAAIGQVQVTLKGKTLEYVSGRGQTGMVGATLTGDLVVRMLQDGLPVGAGEAVNFSILDPKNGATLSVVSAQTDAGGVAATKLTLGTSTGPYVVKAECPADVCTAGGKEVLFQETAVTRQQVTELRASSQLCELQGVVGKRMTPFRVAAVNSLTGLVETGVTIRYERVSFIDMSGNTQVGFPGDASFSYKKIGGGYESATLTPGAKEGTYALKAVCDECQGNPSVVCHAYVRESQIPAEIPEVPTANPFDRDPLTGKPVTPVVRIQEVITQNAGDSFTTEASENLVTLKVQVLPEDFAEQSEITWDVIDHPRDGYVSQVPSQNPVPKPDSKFDAVYRVWLNNVDRGRPAPLRYLVTAKAVVEDAFGRKEALSKYHELKQDEIDKCRQEYVDFGISLADVPRSTFTVGAYGEYGQSVWDCYAYIFPHQKAAEVQRLRQTYSVLVTAGYRSPRANMFLAKSKATKTSEHMFGRAVDLQPVGLGGFGTSNGPLIRPLWLDAICPKILERRTTTTNSAGQEEPYYQPTLLGRCGAGEGLIDWNGEYVEGAFASEYRAAGERNVHLKDMGIPDILEDLMPSGAPNGFSDIFDIGRVIHLGN